MTVFVSIKDLENEFAALAPRLAEGEQVIVTRNGEPVFELKPHEGTAPGRREGGINYEKGRAFLKSIGVAEPFPYVAADFDDPLPEDFLIQPLPLDR